MDFVKLFSADRVVLGIEADTKESVLGSLLEQLAEKDVIPAASVKEILSALVKRESLGSTGIGNGIAIPHAKLPGLDKVVTAFGLVPDGVDYLSVDGEPVQSIFLILSPAADAEQHVSILKWLSTLVRHGDFRRFLLRAKSPDEVVSLIEEMTEELC